MITTDQAIQAFIARERAPEIADRDFMESLQHFSYEHDIVLKTILVVAAIIGVAVCRYGGALNSLFLKVLSWTVGGAITIIAVVSFFVLKIVAPGPFSLADHQFTPNSFQGAKLYYQGHIPILEVKYGERGHYGAGYDQGYIMGSSINTIISRLRTLEWVLGAPEAAQLPALLAKVSETLPQKYRDELRGVTDGFNAWADSQWISPRKISYDEILLFHLMPDRIIYNAGRLDRYYAARNPQPAPAAEVHKTLNGCTAVMAKDPEEGVMMMHTLDWASAGLLGINTVICNRKYSDGTQNSVEIGLPGLIGVLTGMGPTGFTAAMNICASLPHLVEGMPAVFVNRTLLESCKSVKDAKKKLASKATLGPYNLSVADAKKARSFHFYQGKERALVSRELQKSEPLIVTNASYGANAQQYDHMFYSEERDRIIKKLFQEMPQLGVAKLMETSGKLPYVNNTLTLQVAHLVPKTRKIALSWQNTLSGCEEPLTLNTEPLFTR